MKEVNLHYSLTENTYYWTGNEKCNRCNKLCELNAVLLWDYWTTTFRETIFCLRCKDEILKAGGKYQEFKMVTIAFDMLLPFDSIPLWPQRPSLSNFKGETSFDVNNKNFQGIKTIDKTTKLCKQSFEDSQIGLVTEEVLELDQPIKKNVALELISFHKEAEAIDNRLSLSDREDREFKKRIEVK